MSELEAGTREIHSGRYASPYFRVSSCPIRRIGTSMGMAARSLADGGCSQELAALVEHALLDDLVRPPQH